MGKKKRPLIARTPVNMSLPDSLVAYLEALAEFYDMDRAGMTRVLLREAAETAKGRLSPGALAWVEERAGELSSIARPRNRRKGEGGGRLPGVRPFVVEPEPVEPVVRGGGAPRPVDDRG